MSKEWTPIEVAAERVRQARHFAVIFRDEQRDRELMEALAEFKRVKAEIEPAS